MRARAPASAANLGPGFDTLAVALELYVEVEVTPAERLTVRAHGEGRDLPADQSHLAARVAMDMLGTEKVAITVHSDIPVARGLGSSAALAAAAAAAAGAADPLAVAASLDGHPENAAASVLGGLVTAASVGPRPFAARLTLDPEITFVVLVPQRSLPTAKARQALPTHVAHQDAAFNLGRMGMLVAGLADHHLLVRESAEDRLHQSVRTPLFPESPTLLDGLLEAGALAACWSGAGPSLLAFCTSTRATAVRSAGDQLLRKTGLGGRSLLLGADTVGLTVEGEPFARA